MPIEWNDGDRWRKSKQKMHWNACMRTGKSNETKRIHPKKERAGIADREANANNTQNSNEKKVAAF